MEQNSNNQTMYSNQNSSPRICLVCHQPLRPEYYFCPNCGTKIKETALSTTIQTQLLIYAFSIVLPTILFIFIKKWPGTKYSKSNNPKEKQIGQIAWVLLIVSTVLTMWFSYIQIQKMIKSSVNSINSISTDLGSF